MFRPDFGPRRRRSLVSVAVGLDAGRRIIAEVAVNIDDARRHISAARIDHGRTFRSAEVGAADGADLAVDQQDRTIVDPPAFAVEDRCATDQGRNASVWLIGRRIGILVDAD
jgi:hypothetical protein